MAAKRLRHIPDASPGDPPGDAHNELLRISARAARGPARGPPGRPGWRVRSPLTPSDRSPSHGRARPRTRGGSNEAAISRGIPGRLVGPNGLAEWTQREIWPEIATLYASIGRNLP